MDLYLFKSILTSALLLVAILQALTMLQVQGRIHWIKASRQRLRLFHKGEGDLALALLLFTAYICVSRLSVYLQDPRVVSHALFGVIGATLILAKFALARLFRGYLKYVLPLSGALFLSILAIFLTSALWYFVALY